MADINTVLNDFAYGTKQIFGAVEVEVILFGSYSRGDYDAGSDVDVAILADIPREYEGKYTNDLVSLLSLLDEKYNYPAFISPILISKTFFEEWNGTIPFYRNIKNDGVKIGVSRSGDRAIQA